MKRYSFDGSRTPILGRSIAVMAFLCCITHPGAVPAALTKPDVLRVADDASDSGLLLPNEVDDGLRQRFLDLETRERSRAERMDSLEPRAYHLDEPPANIDVPLPADAFGGEIFEERIEVMP